MKYTVLIIIAVLQIGVIYSQESIKCFISTSDFVEKTEYKEFVKPEIRSEGTEFIRIPNMLNSTGKKDKLASISWAVQYKGNYWINMRYSTDYQNLEVYVKPKKIGKYSIVIINKESANLIKNGGTNYGGGLQGVLMKDSDKWGKNWEDKNGNKQKILIFDTSRPNKRHIKGHSNSIGKLLTRKNFNEILRKNFSKDEIKSLKFEHVVNIIENENGDTLPNRG